MVLMGISVKISLISLLLLTFALRIDGWPWLMWLSGYRGGQTF